MLTKKIVVSEEQSGWRLDAFLSLHVSSRSQAEKLIKQSFVQKISGEVILKPSYKVVTEENFLLTIPEKEENHELKPYNISVPIVFEDSYMLVVNKPAGLVVHPGPGHEQDTLVNALIKKIKLSSGVDSMRPGIVHRLDKDVSGLMILSKTDEMQQKLIQLFKEKKIKRVYRALAGGVFKQKEGTIISYISRHPKDRKKFYSFQKKMDIDDELQSSSAKKAITFYKVLDSFEDKIHLVECRLETGRTHQIRVHLSSQGNYILGDPIYRLRSQKANDSLVPVNIKPFIKRLNRLALYSAVLQFSHPITGKSLHFTLSWPKDLHPLLNHIGFGSNQK